MIKIALAYHKPDYLINEFGYIPVHVGREIAKIASKDGKVNEKELRDFISNSLGDNECQDIGNQSDVKLMSKRNRTLNEMTAIYWCWKNYSKIGNPEYFGLGHYRRQFIFNTSLPLPAQRWLPNSDTYVVRDNKMARPYRDVTFAEKIINKFDIITTKKYDARNLNDGRNYTSCKSRYYAIADFNPTLYDKMESMVLELHPDYKVEIEELRNKPKHYLFNMFVMRKDIFLKYCDFIFPILIQLDEANKAERRSIEGRAPGFLSEFLTSMFISHCARVDGATVKELDTIYIDYTRTEQRELTKINTNLVIKYFFVCVMRGLSCGTVLKREKKALKTEIRMLKQEGAETSKVAKGILKVIGF